MSLKSDKLEQRIQEIQEFVAARIIQPELRQTVSQELDNLALSLKQGKLIVQIVGHDAALAQLLQDAIEVRESLRNGYAIRSMPLPEKLVSSVSPAVLVLSSDVEPIRYDLPANQTVVLGRDRSTCQICLPNQYGWISGQHIEIRSEEDASIHWHIRDLNSRNGTYINGQRLQVSQVLQAGDRITLGSQSATPQSPELLFEGQPSLELQKSEFGRQRVDCDSLCLILDTSQNQFNVAKQLIDRASQSQVSLLAIMVNHESHRSSNQRIEDYLADIETYLQTYGSSFKLPSLLLSLSSNNPDNQDSFNRFCQSLEAFAKRSKSEDILVKRLTSQAQSQIELIEAVLKAQTEPLEQEGQINELNSPDIKLNNWQKQIEKVVRQIKDEFKESKRNLLDEYLSNSIISKIRRSVAELEPQVTKREGAKYIQLRSITDQTIDANTTIIRFCHGDLQQWAKEEWKKIHFHQGEGGLSQLFNQTYELLDSLSASPINRSTFQIRQTVEISELPESSFEPIASETAFTEVSLFSYLYKKVRGFFGILLIFSLFGIGRQDVRELIGQFASGAFNQAPWVSFFVLLAAVWLMIYSFIKDYKRYKRTEREKGVEKLRANLASRYESIVKNRLVEEVDRSLMSALDAESQQLIDITNQARQRVDQVVAAAKLRLQERTSERKEQQTELKDALRDLQKLKRF